MPRSYKPSLVGQAITEDELGEQVAKLMPLERMQIEALRQRYLCLPSRIEQSLLDRELPPEDFTYEQALDGLLDEIEALLVDCHRDFYKNRRFPYRKADGAPLEQRPTGNSQFTTSGMYVVGDWYVDAGFRSADYPALEQKLKAALQLELERADFLDRALNVR